MIRGAISNRRVLLGRALERVEQSPPVGRYDEDRQVTVDADGRPILQWQDHEELGRAIAATETETRVRRDPGDPADPDLILATSTITKVRSDPPEPPDPTTEVGIWSVDSYTPGDHVADDLATGRVAF
jgi:hypothetical protein